MDLKGFIKYRILNRQKFIRLGWFSRIEGLEVNGKNTVDSNCEIIGKIKLGFGATISRNCILRGEVVVGKYTQIGPFCGFYSKNHPFDHLSNCVSKGLLNGVLKKNQISSRIVIGNDVWIGAGSTILKGVSIGDGAVIGAGSVVNKDIPAYSIAVGNPCKVVKMRFSESQIALIKKIKWWDWKEDEISENKQLFLEPVSDMHLKEF